MSDRLFSAKSVADRLDVKPKTIYAWMSSGVLPSVKFGRLRRVKESDLEAFQASWISGGSSDTGAAGQPSGDMETAKDASRLERATGRARKHSVAA